MGRGDDDPDLPPPRFVARYQVGFETDRELLGFGGDVWEFLWKPIEGFILRDPYLASHEIEDSEGARFLLTEPARFLDAPPLIVYFKPDETTMRVAFLTVELDPFATVF